MDTVKGARILCLSTRYVGCVGGLMATVPTKGSLPQHTLCGLRPARDELKRQMKNLCLSTRYVGCVVVFYGYLILPQTLLQHTLRRLRRQKYFALFCRMCCKLVDSFSVEQRMLTALTIFPDFSAAKATYVAIIDSLGRTIDRFLWCEHPVFFLLTSTSPDAHTGRCLWHLA